MVASSASVYVHNINENEQMSYIFLLATTRWVSVQIIIYNCRIKYLTMNGRTDEWTRRDETKPRERERVGKSRSRTFKRLHLIRMQTGAEHIFHMFPSWEKNDCKFSFGRFSNWFQKGLKKKSTTNYSLYPAENWSELALNHWREEIQRTANIATTKQFWSPYLKIGLFFPPILLCNKNNLPNAIYKKADKTKERRRREREKKEEAVHIVWFYDYPISKLIRTIINNKNNCSSERVNKCNKIHRKKKWNKTISWMS